MRPSTAEVSLNDVPFTDPVQAINAAAQLVSPKLGIIQSIGRGVLCAQDPRCYSFGITSPDFLPVMGVENSQKAGGAGETVESALAATIGEAVERYCSWFFDRREMIFSSYADLGEEAVHPDDVRLYSPEQCQPREGVAVPDYFTEESRIHWIPGYSITNSRVRLVPAGLVYLGYEFDAVEAKVGRNASTGLASGCTLEEAVLSGLLECVERDAFTVSWQCGRPGKRIVIDGEQLQDRIRRDFRGDHRSVVIEFHDITLDVHIPCAFSYLLRPSEFGRCLSVSSVCRTRPSSAISKCLLEMAQFMPFARYLSSQMSDWVPKDDFSDLLTFDHHCMLYVKRPELIDPALFLYRDAAESVLLSSMARDCDTGTVLGDIRECVRRLDAAGFEVIVVDITTPDVRSAGFRVVRVVVPGLVNLHANEEWPYLGSRRLQKWYEMECGEQLTARKRFRLPHPFP